MISDYVSILEAKIIEVPTTEHAPVLTREMTEWVSYASLAIGRLLGGGLVDRRVFANAQRVVATIPRFSAHNLVLPNGTQFATFSYRQLARELGLSPTSSESAQRAIRLLSLNTESSDGVEYVEACMLLNSGLGGTPIVRRLFKSNSPSMASAWEMVGIRPSPYAGVAGAFEPVATSRTTVAADLKTVARKSSSVEANVETVASETRSGIATADTEKDYSSASDSGSSSKTSRREMNDAQQSVVTSTAKTEPPGTTPPLYPQPSPLPCKGEDDGYNRIIALFRHDPGVKSVETRDAYDRYIERGYSADELFQGITAYLSHTPSKKQARFPFTFLSDPALVKAWCGRPTRKLSPELLKRDSEGYWIYPFSSGASTGYVECPRGASKAEAFKAVERAVEEGRRLP